MSKSTENSKAYLESKCLQTMIKIYKTIEDQRIEREKAALAEAQIKNPNIRIVEVDED